MSEQRRTVDLSVYFAACVFNAVIFFDKVENNPLQNGLAAAVATVNDCNLALSDRQADVVDDSLAPVLFCHVFKFNQIHS